jgi:serine protease
MNHRKTLLAAMLGTASLYAMTASAAEAEKLVFSENPIEGRYIVVLKDEVVRFAGERSNKPEIATVAGQLSRAHGVKLEMSYSKVLPGFVVTASDKALAMLMQDSRVAYIEEDSWVHASATQSGATWGIDRVDQRNLPLNQQYQYDTTASNVHVYIVDTGIRTAHNDFGGRVGNGYTAINDGRGTDDCNGHGTHVASSAAGSTYGVAKAARLHPVRVLGCNGSGTNSGVIAGMDWVANNHVKPAVANMSLGGGASTASDQAVQRMHNAGVTVVVAAGNDNANACNYSPARAPVAITVGSTTSTDARSSFSNFGSCLDIFAPGSSITAAWHTSNSATNTISGTSMASPHVAGVAALYLANNPSATPSQVATALINNATPNKVTSAGSGSPNRLLYSLFGGGGGGPDPEPPTGSLSNGVPVTGLSGATNSERRYTLQVPSGASALTFALSGGSGDADLYVRYGSAPTTTTYDCRPYQSGNNETCNISTAQAGTYHVLVRGYSSYSGATLVGSFQTGGGGGGTAPCSGSNCTAFTGSLGSGQAQIQPNGNYYQSGAGAQRGWLTGPANADFDLELYRWNGSAWTRVASSLSPTSTESINYNGAAGAYYWRIVSYSGSGSYQFHMQTP